MNEEIAHSPPNPLCGYLFGCMSNEEVDIEQCNIDCAFKTDAAKKTEKDIDETQFINIWENGDDVGGPSTANARLLSKAFLLCCEIEHVAIPTMELPNYIGGITLFWNYTTWVVIRTYGNVDFRIGDEHQFSLPFSTFLPLFIEKLKENKLTS